VRLSFVVAILLGCSITACTLPKIVLISDPLSATEYNDLGVAYEASGKTELALEAYESAFKKDRAWDQPLINHGNVHATRGNWQEAQTSYRQALKRNPNNPEAMNNLAYVLMNQDRVTEALEWVGRALDAEPGNPLFMSTKAMALLKAGKKDQALELLESALRELSDDDPMHGKIMEIKNDILFKGTIEPYLPEILNEKFQKDL
jgi:tetratricopeptide (TPR) repeat protein